MELKNDSVSFNQLNDISEHFNFCGFIIAFPHHLFVAFLNEEVQEMLCENWQAHLIVVEGFVLGAASIKNSTG